MTDVMIDSTEIVVTVDATTLDVTVAIPGPQGPSGGGGGGGSSTLIGLTDVTGTAGTGKAPVSDGAAHFVLTDIATQTELAAESSSRSSGDTAAIAAAEAYADAAVAALSTVYQPLDSDLTAIAALTTTSFGRSLLALADAAALRTAAALGTAATSNTGDFDAAGAAAAAQAASQPLDSDLTAIAALSTTAFGRALLALADAAALRTAAALGTAATSNIGDFDAAGAAAAAQAASQPLDSDLTAIAALSTTSYGRGLLALANQAALKAEVLPAWWTLATSPDSIVAAPVGDSASNRAPWKLAGTLTVKGPAQPSWLSDQFPYKALHYLEATLTPAADETSSAYAASLEIARFTGAHSESSIYGSSNMLYFEGTKATGSPQADVGVALNNYLRVPATATGDITQIEGMHSEVNYAGQGAVSSMAGAHAEVIYWGPGAVTSYLAAMELYIDAESPGGPSIPNVYGLRVDDSALGSQLVAFAAAVRAGNMGAAGTTEAVGVYIKAQSGAATNWAILSDGGACHFDSAFFEIGEIANPATPAANYGRLYMRDNGAGKTQLVAAFESGNRVVIATDF